jgi:hypothetical protein
MSERKASGRSGICIVSQAVSGDEEKCFVIKYRFV